MFQFTLCALTFIWLFFLGSAATFKKTFIRGDKITLIIIDINKTYYMSSYKKQKTTLFDSSIASFQQLLFLWINDQYSKRPDSDSYSIWTYWGDPISIIRS